MPALSPTMEEGKLAKWLKQEGDKVEAGDVIAEIETDKATMEVEAVDEGVLGKIVVPAGTEGVKVNAVIAVLLVEGEDKKALENFKIDGGAAPAPQPAAPPAPTPPAPAAPAAAPAASPAPAPVAATPQAPKANGHDHDRVFASPLAKRMAKQANLDLGAVKGSGPHGRIVKADIEAALRRSALPRLRRPRRAARCRRPSAGPRPPYTDIPHSSVRKVIAKRLTDADRDVPQIYLTVDCEIDRLLAARAEINEAAPKDKQTKEPAYKVSVNDLVIKASACALRDVPNMNAIVDGHGNTGVQHGRYRGCRRL